MSNKKQQRTHLWLRQLHKVCLETPTYNIEEEDKQKLKELSKKQDFINGAAFFWIMGALVFDFQKNAQKFRKFKGLNNICAKLPHLAFHSLNAFVAVSLASANNQILFKKSVDIISKYDPEIQVLKYGHIYRDFINF